MYFVLGIKNHPLKDEKTERDNPYQFDTLSSAFRFAEKIKAEDNYATVVEIKEIEVLDGIPPCEN